MLRSKKAESFRLRGLVLFPFNSGSCTLMGLKEQDPGLCFYRKVRDKGRKKVGEAQEGGGVDPFPKGNKFLHCMVVRTSRQG